MSAIGQQFDEELARCRREIEEIAARPQQAQAAYLTVLGENDWRHEARLIEGERQAAFSGGPQ